MSLAKLALIACSALASTLPQSAFGWGATGHRVVGGIAAKHLTYRTRKAVKQLLGTETLAQACTWADEMRSEPEFEYLKPWHFVEIPIGGSYDPATANKSGDTLQALVNAKLQLKDASVSKEKKLEALRLFAHLIGDLHQPLHVGNGQDAGANLCSVTYMGKPGNLHSLWDDDMIESMRLSYTELVAFLDVFSKAQIADVSGGSFEDWASESANVRESLYPLSVNSTQTAEKPSERTYCRADFKAPYIAKELQPKLSYDYRHKHWPLVEKQLRAAGYRLATQLNEIFAK